MMILCFVKLVLFCGLLIMKWLVGLMKNFVFLFINFVGIIVLIMCFFKLWLIFFYVIFGWCCVEIMIVLICIGLLFLLYLIVICVFLFGCKYDNVLFLCILVKWWVNLWVSEIGSGINFCVLLYVKLNIKFWFFVLIVLILVLVIWFLCVFSVWLIFIVMLVDCLLIDVKIV